VRRLHLYRDRARLALTDAASGSSFWPLTIFLPMSAVSVSWQLAHVSFLRMPRAPPCSVPISVHSMDATPGWNTVMVFAGTLLQSGGAAKTPVAPAANAAPTATEITRRLCMDCPLSM
jgi:hypothetical protein